MTKPVIDIQPDLFWEDGEGASNGHAAAKWFVVNPLSNALPKRSEILIRRRGNYLRASLDHARLFGYNFDFANALKWLPVFRDACVNKDAYFTDAKNAQLKISLYGPRFVRPASPFKEFAGQVFDIQNFATELNWMKQGKNLDATEIICVIAAPVQIEREWRCIFLDNRFASGSRYMSNGSLDVSPEVPCQVIEFANTIAIHDYFINNFAFCLDIGLVNGTPALVEVNGFETASFYAADLAIIYETLARSFAN